MRSNLFLRFIMGAFDKDQETTSFKMRLLLLLFGHRTTQVLYAERGFDLCILRAVLSGQCKSDEILALTNELLDKMPSNDQLKQYNDFIKQARAADPTRLKYLFDSEVFYPTLIIMAETKVALLREINSALIEHEKKLEATDEEVPFDYSNLNLELPENTTFLKIGGYYIEVLLLRPEYLRGIDLQNFNARLLEYIASGGLTIDVEVKTKLMYILLLEVQAAICDQDTLNTIFAYVLHCRPLILLLDMTVDNFETLSFNMQIVCLDFYLFMNQLYYYDSDNPMEVFMFFRAELEKHFQATSPEENSRSCFNPVLAGLFLKAFMLKATSATEPVDELFGDLTDWLIAHKSTNPLLEQQAERVVSTLCQRSMLNPETISRVKAHYSEQYFALMGIGFADYIRVEYGLQQDTFPQKPSFETVDKQLTIWLKPQNMQEKLLVEDVYKKLPLYPDLSDDRIISRYGDQIKTQK